MSVSITRFFIHTQSIVASICALQPSEFIEAQPLSGSLSPSSLKETSQTPMATHVPKWTGIRSGQIIVSTHVRATPSDKVLEEGDRSPKLALRGQNPFL